MKSILIADDDPAFRETLAKKCAKLGPRIWTAADGAQVMQSLKQSRPNLMIIDVDMPSGDGLKVVERMQQDPSIERMPVIFCTGHGDTEILERCRALNAPCIVKGGEAWSQLQPLICRILGLISDIPGARKGVPDSTLTIEYPMATNRSTGPGLLTWSRRIISAPVTGVLHSAGAPGASRSTSQQSIQTTSMPVSAKTSPT